MEEAAADRAVEAPDVRQWSVAELRASRRVVPAAPGVYTFLDAAGAALYVGKSVDLRQRLSSYFAAAPARRKTARLMRVARAVRAERRGSEFAALLREAELVQALRPPFNTRMAAPEKYVYLRIDYAHPFPRLSLTTAPDEDGRFLGPYVQKRRLVAVVDALNDAFGLRTCEPIPDGEPCWRRQTRRCAAPCVGAVAAGDYGRRFLPVREAVAGRAAAALRQLRERRDRFAAGERFEAARAVQNRIEAVERLRRVLYASQAPGCDAIVVQPGIAPGSVDLWAIAGGSVRGAANAPIAALRESFERVWAALAARRAAEPIAKDEVDRRCIVHRWVRDERNAAACVRVDGRDREGVWPAVVAAVRRLPESLL